MEATAEQMDRYWDGLAERAAERESKALAGMIGVHMDSGDSAGIIVGEFFGRSFLILAREVPVGVYMVYTSNEVDVKAPASICYRIIRRLTDAQVGEISWSRQFPKGWRYCYEIHAD